MAIGAVIAIIANESYYYGYFVNTGLDAKTCASYSKLNSFYLSPHFNLDSILTIINAISYPGFLAIVVVTVIGLGAAVIYSSKGFDLLFTKQISVILKEKCPQCKKYHLELYKNYGGKFKIRCKNYPKCKYEKKLTKEQLSSFVKKHLTKQQLKQLKLI